MSRESRRREDESYREWNGGYRRYDIVKEATIALGVVLALVLVLTILFSSPDERRAQSSPGRARDPVDFVTTATTELDGSSGTGSYGPPYNHAVRRPAHLVHPPSEVARESAPGQHRPGLRDRAAALDHAASPPAGGASTLRVRLRQASRRPGRARTRRRWPRPRSAPTTAAISVQPGDYGPVPTMMGALLTSRSPAASTAPC